MRRTSFRSSWVVYLLSLALAVPQGALLGAQAKAAGQPKPPRNPQPAATATANGLPAGTTPTPAGRGRSRSRPAPPSGISRRSRAGRGSRRSSRWSAVAYTPTGAKEPALGTIKIEGPTSVAVDDRVVSMDLRITEYQLLDPVARPDKGTRRRRAVTSAERAGDRPRSRARLCGRQPAAGEERRQHQGRSAEGVLGAGARGTRQPRRRGDLEPDRWRGPALRGQHELGPVRAHTEQGLYSRYNDALAAGGGGDGAVDGRRPASCPTASRSCQPTRTGRTSRPRCPARSFGEGRRPRCSSAPRRPS